MCCWDEVWVLYLQWYLVDGSKFGVAIAQNHIELLAERARARPRVLAPALPVDCPWLGRGHCGWAWSKISGERRISGLRSNRNILVVTIVWYTI